MFKANYSYLCVMEHTNNAVLIQCATLDDIERMINVAVEKRMECFYKSIQKKPLTLVKRKEAAKILGVSLPTLDAYSKYGILHPKHVGGRVFFYEEDLLAVKRR